MSNGWKLVPVDPTEEMLEAGRNTTLAGDEDVDAPEDYRAVFVSMVEAAPQPPLPAHPFAWTDDGAVRAGATATAHRVITDETKRGMHKSTADSFNVPLYLHPQPPSVGDMPHADEIHQIAFEEGQPADSGDGYLFTAEEFDLFVERLLARANQQPPSVGELKLNKTLQAWGHVDEALCANSNSPAANLYLIRDAKKDIAALGRAVTARDQQIAAQAKEIAELRAVLESLREPLLEASMQYDEAFDSHLLKVDAALAQQVKP